MTRKEKIDFFEAVYRCALGDGNMFSQMSVCIDMNKEALEIWTAAFNLAKEDINFELSKLQNLARSKAERFLERKRAEPFVKELVDALSCTQNG